MITAEQAIAALGLVPHPEGGWYRETFRDLGPAAAGATAPIAGSAGSAGGAEGAGGAGSARGAFTAIYYLLRSGERSAWHRLKDAVEIWHHYAGAPLELAISLDGGKVTTHLLGADLPGGERPQALVPAGAWQTARSRGDWSLVGCTVSPAFELEAMELAPPGWHPG